MTRAAVWLSIPEALRKTSEKIGLTLILVGGEPMEMLDCPIYVTPGSVRVLDVDATNGRC